MRFLPLRAGLGTYCLALGCALCRACCHIFGFLAWLRSGAIERACTVGLAVQEFSSPCGIETFTNFSSAVTSPPKLSGGQCPRPKFFRPEPLYPAWRFCTTAIVAPVKVDHRNYERPGPPAHQRAGTWPRRKSYGCANNQNKF